MVDAQALKARLWADTGDRQDPEDAGIDRADGWDVTYEQLGSGSFPERAVFNQLLRELTGFHADLIAQGVLAWDPHVDYLHPAFTVTATGMHVSLRASGPAAGGAADPDAVGQTAWRRY